MGHIWVDVGCLGGHTTCREVGSGSGEVSSLMWGAVVGTREQEGMGLVLGLGSQLAYTHPVVTMACTSPSPLPSLHAFVLGAQAPALAGAA